MQIGLVVKSTGSTYAVIMPDGEQLECHIKGNFRIRGIRTTNPIAVGDQVQVERQEDGTNWIVNIEERRNYIIRRSTNLSKESHILASNLDQVVLMVTINHPTTSTTFIDRFLATAEAYRVPVVILFNKIDLLNDEEQNRLNELRQLYEHIGYNSYAFSIKDISPSDLTQLRSELFENKVTLISGNSGVGKSTLLNLLLGSEVTRTGIISSAHDKGMHTTTFSQMYALPPSATNDAQAMAIGWIIDTPGIKGFGTVQMEKEEVSHYFREIFQIGHNCRYSNCLHTGEPGCAVQQAVVEGRIALSRFESYLSILGDCDETKYR